MIQFQHWIHQWHFWVICTRICCFNFTFLEVAGGGGWAVAVIIRLNENIHKWKLLTAWASISSERRYLNKIFPMSPHAVIVPLLFLLQVSICVQKNRELWGGVNSHCYTMVCASAVCIFFFCVRQLWYRRPGIQGLSGTKVICRCSNYNMKTWEQIFPHP